MEVYNVLKPDALVQVTKNAFSKSIKIMADAVKREYRSMFPGSAYYKAVHYKAFKTGKGAVVDINRFKRRRKGDPMYKSYVVRILELGSYKTGERKTKKGWSRGVLTPRPFYAPGISASQQQAEASYMQNLDRAMAQKINQLAK